MGWANKLIFWCDKWWEKTVITSEQVNNENRRQQRFEVNARCVMGFREIGGGLESIKKSQVL